MSTTTVGEFQEASRELGITGSVEKRTLLWLAARMPARINSDHLTGLALAAMVGAGLSFWLASVTPVGLVLAAVFLAINWFGDSLDGTLARVRQHQRPRYGYYVDHVVDAFGALFLFGGLALSGYMSPVIAFGLLVAYFMVSIEVYLAAQSLGMFKITHFYLGPTELRILLAIGNLVLLVVPEVMLFGATYRLFDVGGVAVTACPRPSPSPYRRSGTRPGCATRKPSQDLDRHHFGGDTALRGPMVLLSAWTAMRSTLPDASFRNSTETPVRSLMRKSVPAHGHQLARRGPARRRAGRRPRAATPRRRCRSPRTRPSSGSRNARVVISASALRVNTVGGTLGSIGTSSVETSPSRSVSNCTRVCSRRFARSSGARNTS